MIFMLVNCKKKCILLEISLTYYLHLGKMELNPSPGKNERLQKLDLTSNLLKWRGLRTTNERLDPDITLTCLWELFCCFLLNLKWLLMLLEQFLWIVLVKAVWTRLFVIAHLCIIGGKIRKICLIGVLHVFLCIHRQNHS